MKISPSEQAIIYIRLRNAIESWTQNNSWLFIKVQCRSCLIYQLHPRQRQKYILVYFIISHTRLHDWPVCFLELKTWAILCINLVRHERMETQQEDPSSIRQFLWAMKLLFLVDQDNYFSCGSEKNVYKSNHGAGGTALRWRTALTEGLSSSPVPLWRCSQLSVTMASVGSAASDPHGPPCSHTYIHAETHSHKFKRELCVQKRLVFHPTSSLWMP